MFLCNVKLLSDLMRFLEPSKEEDELEQQQQQEEQQQQQEIQIEMEKNVLMTPFRRSSISSIASNYSSSSSTSLVFRTSSSQPSFVFRSPSFSTPKTTSFDIDVTFVKKKKKIRVSHYPKFFFSFISGRSTIFFAGNNICEEGTEFVGRI